MSSVNPYESPESEIHGELQEDSYQPRIFAFSGRIGRLRYLAYLFIYYLMFFAFVGIAMAVTGNQLFNSAAVEPGAASVTIIFITIVFYVIFFVAIFVLAKRRINDLNSSGWLNLLFFVPLANFIYGLVLIFAPGTKGENDYGPQPTSNPVGIWILGLIFPFIFFIGIAASFALPAYQQYVERARAEQTQVHPIKEFSTKPASYFS